MAATFMRTTLLALAVVGVASQAWAQQSPTSEEPPAADSAAAPAGAPAVAPNPDTASDQAPSAAPAPEPAAAAAASAPVETASVVPAFDGNFKAPTSRIPIATNQAGPINLQWAAVAGLELPGFAGLRLGADFYAPVLPIYVAGRFVKSWGLGDEQWSSSSSTWEVRAGFSLSSGYRLMKEDESFDLGDSQSIDVAIKRPVFDRFTPFVGYRSRSTGEAESLGFLTVGFADATGCYAVGSVPELGTKELHRTATIDLQLLYSLSSKRELLRRLGADATVRVVKYDLSLVPSFGLGWDGEVLLFHLGVGFGGTHSFEDVPESSTIK
jgi:hypothetical protein